MKGSDLDSTEPEPMRPRGKTKGVCSDNLEVTVTYRIGWAVLPGPEHDDVLLRICAGRHDDEKVC